MVPLSPVQTSDASRLQAWIERRDEGALAALFAGHAPLLRAIAQRVLHDAVESDDVVQEVFIRLADYAHTITGPVGPWLRQVAGNTALTHLRSRTRRQVREAEIAAIRGDAADGLDGEDSLRDQVAECVAALTPAERDLVLRVFWGGEAQGALARELRISRVAIHKRLHASLDRLRRLLRRRGVRVAVPALVACLIDLAGQEPQALIWLAQRAWWRAPAAIAAGAGALGLALLAVAWLVLGARSESDRTTASTTAPPLASLANDRKKAVPPASLAQGLASGSAAAPAEVVAPDDKPAPSRPGVPRPSWLAPAVDGWRPCIFADWSFWPPSSRFTLPQATTPDLEVTRCIVDADQAFRVEQPHKSMLMVALPIPTTYVDGIQIRFEYRRLGDDNNNTWREKLFTIVHTPELPGTTVIVACVLDVAEAATAEAVINTTYPVDPEHNPGLMGLYLDRSRGPVATINLWGWSDPRLGFEPLVDAPPWWPLIMLGGGHEFRPIRMRPLPATERLSLTKLMLGEIELRHKTSTDQ